MEKTQVEICYNSLNSSEKAGVKFIIIRYPSSYMNVNLFSSINYNTCYVFSKLIRTLIDKGSYRYTVTLVSSSFSSSKSLYRLISYEFLAFFC